MAVVKCKNSHYYDNEKFSECPHCARMAEAGTGETLPASLEAQRVGNYAEEYIRKNLAGAPGAAGMQPDFANAGIINQERGYADAGIRNQGYGNAASGAAGREDVEEDMEKTVSIYEKRQISRCTAGWLVCVNGADYGKDFSLYAGFNRIGRNPDNDIVLTDVHVSGEEHCSVIYEEKKNLFYILPKAGSLTYIGEEMADCARELKGGQVITVGETQLELVVFCIGEKRWPKRNP